ncbi:MAG: zinc-binding dehydrogenase [Phenylobacterium sp.]
MRAVVRRNKQLVCDEIAEPVAGAGQVLVKTLSCGICGSDLHALHSFEHMLELGARAGAPSTIDPSADIVFGHEFCAEILDHGPDTPKRLKAGARVVTIPIILGPAGMDAVGYSNRYPGGYSERMVLMESLLLEVPNGLSDNQAAMTEPFAVGEHAVAQSAAADNAVSLVIGCGPVGLAVIAALKARGLGPVVAADYSPARRKIAEVLGADVVIDPATESPHARWDGLGVPLSMGARAMAQMMGQQSKRAVIFECVGVPGVLQGIIDGAPGGSQIIVAGVCMATDQIEPSLCINKQLEFKFVLGYSPEEFAATLHNIAEGRIDVRPTITDIVGLSGVAAAFAALADPETQCKVVVDPRL